MSRYCAPEDDDKFHEECGVFGIFSQDEEKDVVPLVYYGLFSLQHRGQERFTPEALSALKGHGAIGHVRYPTTGAGGIENAQPFLSRFKSGSVSVAHNGMLTNADMVRELLEDSGVGFASNSDSEVIVKLITKKYKKGLEKSLADTVKFIKGSYALTVLTDHALVGIRDPNGIRPLCFGRLGKSYILASESCAIDAVGGEFIRDVEPGEIIIITKDEVQSFTFTEKTKRAGCAFEYIYFARPDSVIDRVDVYESRIRAGEILGRESGIAADLVIGVPDSGIPAAIGYGRATKTPYGLGIVKSKYVARTFIAPNQALREKTVSVKHNVIHSEVKGKRVVVIDDSIVRGTTIKRLVAILKKAGAKEVHIRISSPPVQSPCYFGIDTPHRKDLISNGSNVESLRKTIGADSLAFISVPGLLESIDGGNDYCLGCFTGEYPMPVSEQAES